MSVDKNFSVNGVVMLPNQLLTPELGVESMDFTSAAAVSPAPMSLQNISVEITLCSSYKLTWSYCHSSVSEFLNYTPADVCMCIIKKAEIIVAHVQNGTDIYNALYFQLACYIVLLVNLC